MQEEVEEVEAKLSEAEHSASHGAVRAFFAQFCTPVFPGSGSADVPGGCAPPPCSVLAGRAAPVLMIAGFAACPCDGMQGGAASYRHACRESGRVVMVCLRARFSPDAPSILR